ncbi:hypothetical protein G5C01_05970 [Moraxella bovoculi]|nr:hypothetical protein [Moraxella bovoculi]NSM10902.1 hypothetical protein [Moraxella bovoculi]
MPKLLSRALCCQFGSFIACLKSREPDDNHDHKTPASRLCYVGWRVVIYP